MQNKIISYFDVLFYLKNLFKLLITPFFDWLCSNAFQRGTVLIHDDRRSYLFLVKSSYWLLGTFIGKLMHIKHFA